MLVVPPESCPRPRAPGEGIPKSKPKLHLCKFHEGCSFVVTCGLKCGIFVFPRFAMGPRAPADLDPTM